MNDTRHDEFDRRMRALHARAVEQVPSRTLYELQVRRANAAAGAPPTPPRSLAARGGWWLAGGLAAVFALGIGLRQPILEGSPAADAPPPLAAAGTAADTAAWEDGLAALDEDPDLYLWLASQDSLILAME